MRFSTARRAGCRPTPEALELFPEAERLFAGLEGIRRKTADLRLGRAGLVRIAASTPPAMALLPRALAAFRARHPEILLRCARGADRHAGARCCATGDAALALALDDRLPPDIEAEVLGRDRVLLPSAGGPSAGRGRGV